MIEIGEVGTCFLLQDQEHTNLLFSTDLSK